MDLFVLAHRGEANFILKKEHYKEVQDISTPLKKNLFTNGNQLLLLSGEGIEKALCYLSILLSQSSKIERIFNLGIAGGLDQYAEVHQVYPVKTVYRELGGRPAFESFLIASSEQKNSLDLVSSCERVTDDNYAQQLGNMASLVDRELWGAAFVAQIFQKPLYSYKVVSDRAGLGTDCQLIRKKAELYGQLLHETYLNIIGQAESLPSQEKLDWEKMIPNGFYFTYAQKKEMEKLLQFYILVEKKSLNEAIQKLPWIEIQEKDIPAKRRTSLMLKFLHQKLNPFSKE